MRDTLIRSSHRRLARPSRALHALAGAFLLSLASPVLAQVAQLDAAVIGADVVTDDQKGAIRKYVETHAPKLGSEIANDVEAGREALIDPLLQPRVSASFRVAYSAEAVPALRGALDKAKNDHQAINALSALGEIATKDAAEVAIASLTSKSIAVRYQAAFALNRVFEAQRRTPGVFTMREDAAAAILDSLRDPLSRETDGHVLAALMRACATAAAVSTTGFELRQQAIIALSRGVVANKLVADARTPLSVAALDGLSASLVAIRDQIARAGTPMRPETLKAAVEFAGAILAHAARTVAGGELISLDKAAGGKSRERDRYAAVAEAAVTALSQAGTALGGNPGALPELGKSLRPGTPRDDGSFVNDVKSIVGPGGTLSKPPFSLSVAFKAS